MLRRWFTPKRRTAYFTHKEAARALIKERVAFFAGTYGFAPKRLAIRDTKRSWGSCSALGNLNFSYKLLFLPPCLRDYIVVHELSHLRHLHHKQSFWDEVVAIMPDALLRAQQLRDWEKTRGTSLKSLAILKARHDENCTNCCTVQDVNNTMSYTNT